MEPTSSESTARTDGAVAGGYSKLVRFLLPGLYIAALATGLVMLLLLAIGLQEMVWGVLVFWGVAPMPPSLAQLSRDAAALQMATKGLEFLFLAPLGFLLVLGVARYVWACVQPATLLATQVSEKARIDLLIVKAFTIALLAAVAAANVVSKALTPDGLHYEEAVSGSLVIAVLAVYFVALEHLVVVIRREAK